MRDIERIFGKGYWRIMLLAAGAGDRRWCLSIKGHQVSSLISDEWKQWLSSGLQVGWNLTAMTTMPIRR